ncbi:hypothetical protein TanjilG_10504 [Lupinus angustifolius]|uniref:Uncharacterized protein n=1 Tax=Lupinus angustifolius TaxID=3871 RepID=A0A1J7FWA1_LUPAN|nr:hypothetical protein TanjilG_10504 [Lupinus angustifolius]
MKTGTKRRSNGGGGKGGNTNGNTRMDKVRRLKIMIMNFNMQVVQLLSFESSTFTIKHLRVSLPTTLGAIIIFQHHIPKQSYPSQTTP